MTDQTAVFSLELTNADIIRLAGARILTKYPMVGSVQDWAIEVVKHRDGVCLNLLGPVAPELRK